MKPHFRFLLALAPVVLFLSCANKSTPPGDRPHATVMLRDGTQVAGSVTESSAASITIAGDDGVTRTIPTAQVKTVEYAAPPAAATPAPAPAPAAAPDQASAPPADGAPAPDPVHDNHFHPSESAITTKTYRLAPGTRLAVRTEETIDSARAVEGQTFAAEITRDVRDRDNAVVIPRGANAQIVIRSVSKGGKFHGASDLVLDLASVSVAGRKYALSTVDLAEKGRDGVGANRRTGEFAGGGAAVGAIIGAIAGGGKGAAIGGGSGAGAGALAEIVTQGAAVKIPVESVLTFQLDRPLSVVAR